MGFDTGECGLKAIGGEISFAGGYFIHTFKESGNFSVRQPGIKNLEVFAVGGGGGGGTLETSTQTQEYRGVRGGAGGVARLGFFGQTVDGPSMDMYEPLGEMPTCLPETDCLTIKITIGEGGPPDAPGSNTAMEWGENDDWFAEGGAAGAAAERPDDESPDDKPRPPTPSGGLEAFSGGGAGCSSEKTFCAVCSATGGDARPQVLEGARRQEQHWRRRRCTCRRHGRDAGWSRRLWRGHHPLQVRRDWANYLLDVTPLPGTVPRVGIRDRDVTVWKSGGAFPWTGSLRTMITRFLDGPASSGLPSPACATSGS